MQQHAAVASGRRNMATYMRTSAARAATESAATRVCMCVTTMCVCVTCVAHKILVCPVTIYPATFKLSDKLRPMLIFNALSYKTKHDYVRHLHLIVMSSF